MAVLATASSRHGLRIDLKSVWKNKRDGLNTKDALIATGLSADEASILHYLWMAEVESYGWLYLDQLIPGARDSLTAWTRAGHQLILLSARTRSEWLSCQVRNLGIYAYFDAVVCVDPAQAIQQKSKALKELKADIFIGDTESDYKSAVNTKTYFIAVSSGQRTSQYLSARGCQHVAESIASISCIQAAAQLDSPSIRPTIHRPNFNEHPLP